MGQNQFFREPTKKRAVAFFDGQNLYHQAKATFGHKIPNYDPKKLFTAVCNEKGWLPQSVRFYTGMPKFKEQPKWHKFWRSKLLRMRREGIDVTDPWLHYHPEKVILRDGTIGTRDKAREKGIDVRLALDMVRLAQRDQYDVAILFSQDQDLAEAIKDIKEIAREKRRWIKLVCAFPNGPNASSKRGVDGCDWLRMEEAFYQNCLDLRDHWR